MILITGGLGFIGLHTARTFVERGEQVVLAQYSTARRPEFLTPHIGRTAFVEKLDVTDGGALEEIGKRYPIDSIVHLAAPRLNRLGPTDEYCVNIFGLSNILDAARRWGVRRLSIASSQAVYAGVRSGPFHEAMPLRVEGGTPTEVFKKSFEILGLHYAERAGLDAVIMRIGAIYGPLFQERQHIPARMAHAAKRGDTDLGGDVHADDAGDFCYVKDCAEGIFLLHQAGSLSHRIYNIGSGAATTFAACAAAVRRFMPGPDFPLLEGRSRSPTGRDNPYMDISRIRRDTGYEPKYMPIERAIEDYAAWLRDHDE